MEHCRPPWSALAWVLDGMDAQLEELTFDLSLAVEVLLDEAEEHLAVGRVDEADRLVGEAELILGVCL